MSWILVTYQLPSDQSRARVAVWREVRRGGALHLQQSIVAFPDTDGFRATVERFRELVASVGGESLALDGRPLDERDEQRLVAVWNDARDAEYAELTGKCNQFLKEIEHEFAIEKFTTAELEEEEAEVEKLERWFERIAARDVRGAPGRATAEAALQAAQAELARYADAVFEQTQARPS
jgi:Protein ChrB, N-terminal